MKRFLITTAAILGLCSIVWLLQANRRLARELEHSQSALEKAAHSAPPAPPTPAPTRAPSESTAATSLATKVPTADATNWLNFVRDPGQRAAQFDQAVIGIERDYGRFFQHIADWPPDRQEVLKRQLAFNRLALIEALVPPHLPPTKEDLQQQNEKLARAQADADQKLRALLGPSDFEKFDRFEMARGYTEPVGEITNAMRAKGAQLNDQTQEAILNGYAAAMRATAEASKGVDPSHLNEIQRAEMQTRQRREIQSQLLKQLSGVLDEKQLDLFLQSHLEQSEGG